MKKNHPLSNDIWVFPSMEPGIGLVGFAPVGTNDTLVIDEGEPYPLTVDAGGSSNDGAGSAKPVAAIAQLADYLVNGFWQYNSTIAHHWASNTITYNISSLNTGRTKAVSRSARQSAILRVHHALQQRGARPPHPVCQNGRIAIWPGGE